MKMEIYYNDLTEKAQTEYDKIQEKQGWASDTNNHDIVPLAVLDIEPREEEK